MFRSLAAAGAAFALAGCATPFAGAPMQQRITADVASFNEAYADAANNLILWNVLRARDRLPRTYVAIKDITTQQGRSLEQNWGLESLDLGGDFANDPWGALSLGGTASSSSEPNYGISPIVADDINRAVISPTPPQVFSLYWESWGPHDVLLSVLVHKAMPLSMSATDILALDCLGDAANRRNRARATPLQEFVAPAAGAALENQIDEPDVRDLANDTRRADGESFFQFARWVKENRSRVTLHLIEMHRCDDITTISYGGRTGRSLADALALADAFDGDDARRIAMGRTPNTLDVLPTSQVTTVQLEVQRGDRENEFVGTWELQLRSLDQAIYYLGESIRQPTDEAAFREWTSSRHNAEAEGGLAQPPQIPDMFGRLEMVRADCSAIDLHSPLFRVHRSEVQRVPLPRQSPLVEAPSDRTDWQFDRVRPAARVLYRGAVYEAGRPSPINSSCRAETDFTGQVLTLLSQLLASNQSPDALRLPARFAN